jgi:hypothetical protein
MAAAGASPAKRTGTAGPPPSPRRSRAPTSLVAAVLGQPVFRDVAWVCPTDVDACVE